MCSSNVARDGERPSIDLLEKLFASGIHLRLTACAVISENNKTFQKVKLINNGTRI